MNSGVAETPTLCQRLWQGNKRSTVTGPPVHVQDIKPHTENLLNGPPTEGKDDK
jgi:hypothetical protein